MTLPSPLRHDQEIADLIERYQNTHYGGGCLVCDDRECSDDYHLRQTSVIREAFDRGQKIAEELGSLANRYGSDGAAALIAGLTGEHRTLQQGVVRFLRDYLNWLARADDMYFDGRNEASRKFARAVVKATDDVGLPLI